MTSVVLAHEYKYSVPKNPKEYRGVNSGTHMTVFLMTRMAEDTAIKFEASRCGCLITQSSIIARPSYLIE